MASKDVSMACLQHLPSIHAHGQDRETYTAYLQRRKLCHGISDALLHHCKT